MIWHVTVDEIQRGLKNGVHKVNIDTSGRMAMTGQIRRVLTEDPREFDPRKYIKPAMAALTKFCKRQFEEFGTAGNTTKTAPQSVAEMAKRYKSGSLAPVFS